MSFRLQADGCSTPTLGCLQALLEQLENPAVYVMLEDYQYTVARVIFMPCSAPCRVTTEIVEPGKLLRACRGDGLCFEYRVVESLGIVYVTPVDAGEPGGGGGSG